MTRPSRAPLFARIAAVALVAAAALMLPPQPNRVHAQPAPGTSIQAVNQINFRTFGAAATFTPATTATADFFTLTGPQTANGVARITRVECALTSTAAALIDVNVIKRSAIPTVAGTSTTATAVSRDSQDATAASSVVRAYTVAPTPGAAVGTIRNALAFSTAAGTPAQTTSVVFDFRSENIERQGLVLRAPATGASTEVLALNATMPAGASARCNITWTETGF